MNLQAVPTMTKPQRRFEDLSIYLENDVLSDPPPLAPRITFQTHADTLPEFMAMLPGTQAADYPDGEAAAADAVAEVAVEAAAQQGVGKIVAASSASVMSTIFSLM